MINMKKVINTLGQIVFWIMFGIGVVHFGAGSLEIIKNTLNAVL